MDTTRWETEALRTGPRDKPRPPKPSAKRRRADARWVTLREAEEATGIPVNTLRKWVRKSDLPSYLESDGDIALRMVDLDAVERRAVELGREIQPLDRPEAANPDHVEPRAAPRASDPQPASAPTSASDLRDGPEQAPSADTMIVPLDAWNKMLAQLGNLHEAGQQLADARERAAKAETEAAFLRSQLAELRATAMPESVSDRPEPSPTPDESPTHEPLGHQPAAATTTYWRILTSRVLSRRGRD